MNSLTRREFLARTLILSAAALALTPHSHSGAAPSGRKMHICLSPGSIGVSANQLECIRLAHQHGFESIEPFAEFLAVQSEGQLSELLSDLKNKGLVFGAAGFPVEFRQDDAKFSESMKRLPRLAAGLQRAGVDRLGTWISPCDQSRTYLQNFKQHARRLREAASVLKDHGQRLGLEYVGTKTSRERCRYPFIHTMAETKELISEIGTGNVGLVLDSWHWWQADDTVQDLLSLRNEEVISVDLNDAPAEVAKDKQSDGKRELPMATGVIDLAAFLKALQQIGYNGPLRAEPFNRPLNELNNEDACAATIVSMKKAMALLG
jgi:sugar phosphate isomerase/epimerase